MCLSRYHQPVWHRERHIQRRELHKGQKQGLSDRSETARRLFRRDSGLGGKVALDSPLLQMTGIVKAFPGVRALDTVDFSLLKGEVHTLMGENGAGKST